MGNSKSITNSSVTNTTAASSSSFAKATKNFPSSSEVLGYLRQPASLFRFRTPEPHVEAEEGQTATQMKRLQSPGVKTVTSEKNHKPQTEPKKTKIAQAEGASFATDVPPRHSVRGSSSPNSGAVTDLGRNELVNREETAKASRKYAKAMEQNVRNIF